VPRSTPRVSTPRPLLARLEGLAHGRTEVSLTLTRGNSVTSPWEASLAVRTHDALYTAESERTRLEAALGDVLRRVQA
jgi:hypothetical protein